MLCVTAAGAAGSRQGAGAGRDTRQGRNVGEKMAHAGLTTQPHPAVEYTHAPSPGKRSTRLAVHTRRYPAQCGAGGRTRGREEARKRGREEERDAGRALSYLPSCGSSDQQCNAIQKAARRGRRWAARRHTARASRSIIRDVLDRGADLASMAAEQRQQGRQRQRWLRWWG